MDDADKQSEDEFPLCKLVSVSNVLLPSVGFSFEQFDYEKAGTLLLVERCATKESL